MADFCLECFNKLHRTHYTKVDVIEEWGICEECGEHKIVVVDLRGYGLFNSIFWLFNRIELKALSFYDRHLWRTVNDIRYRYTKQQRQAIAGQIPMTEELFWECFNVAMCRCHTTEFDELLKKYPQYLQKRLDELESERRGNPQLLEQEEQYWQELRARLVEACGEEYVTEHYNE